LLKKKQEIKDRGLWSSHEGKLKMGRLKGEKGKEEEKKKTEALRVPAMMEKKMKPK